MSGIVKALPHQGKFLQIPYVYPGLRFFFLIAGYAAGKTSALVYAVLRAVSYFSGKYDKEHKKPKIAVCGISLTFLKKTFSGALLQYLDNSKTPYSYNKADNIIETAGVQIFLIAIQDEGAIFGYDCCIPGYAMVMTSKGEVRMDSIKEGDLVLTRNGYRKVTAFYDKGMKPLVRVSTPYGDLDCTEDHKFITAFDKETEATKLTNTDELLILNSKELKICQHLHGNVQLRLQLLNSMESDITDTLKALLTGKATTLPALTQIKKEASQLIIETSIDCVLEKYQKDMLSIIKMETTSTTALKILNCLLNLNTRVYTTTRGHQSVEKRSMFILKRLWKFVKKNSKTQSMLQLKNDSEQHQDITVRVLYAVKALCQLIQELSIAQKNALERIEKNITNIQLPQEKREYAKYAGNRSYVINTRILRRAHATVKTLNAGELSHVYDITVEGEHEFFANGILVHNCAVFVDELDELPTSVSMSVVKALNDRARQQISGCRPPFLAFASTAQGLKGMYNTVMEFKQKGIAYAVIHGRTKDNVYLPPDYIKAMYSIYSGKEKDCYLDGRFVAVDSGLVFAQYNHAVHFLDSISLWDKLPRGQNVYLAQDFNQGAGFNKCIACTVFSGTAYIIKEYEFPDWQAAPKVFRYDFPEQNLYWIPDMTFKDNFVIASKSLRQYNIHLILKSANPLVSDRVVAVNALFHLNRLLITGDCVEVDKSVMTYQYDKKTGKPQKGSTSKAPDHYADTIGYFVYYILCFDRDFKDVFDVTINRFNRKRDRGEVYDVSGIIPKEVKGVNR